MRSLSSSNILLWKERWVTGTFINLTCLSLLNSKEITKPFPFEEKWIKLKKIIETELYISNIRIIIHPAVYKHKELIRSNNILRVHKIMDKFNMKS